MRRPSGLRGAARQTRADALKDAIAQAILNGDYAPGQRLDEVSVAQRFAVSRTPVREALKQLAALDLVELRPHRGAVVAGLQPSRLFELFEAMGEIEAACAKLAAERLSEAERAAVEAAWASCDAALQANDIERIHATNGAFHAAIQAGAHNQFLAEAARMLRRKLAPLARFQLQSDRTDQSAREHRDIMAALRARRSSEAERAMRHHLVNVGRTFDRWLEAIGPRHDG